MGYEDFDAVTAAREAKLIALKQEKGHLDAMLEIQEWARTHAAALKHAGLYESLMRLTVK
jgi:hypothetical protein